MQKPGLADRQNRFKSKDVTNEEDADFKSLGLPPKLLSGLVASGFEKPSPIQLRAIPLGRFGVDLVVQAKAGTGKTCVFAVVALENLQADVNGPQVLILAPTREIAVQINDVITSIARDMEGVKSRAFIGGMSVKEDQSAVRSCSVVVGTPGRIKQLIEEKHFVTKAIRLLILDEADKLLDATFDETVNWICSALPEKKQMLALSATYPQEMAAKLKKYMRDVTYVQLDTDQLGLVGIKQFYCQVPVEKATPEEKLKLKFARVCEILPQVSFNQCVVFNNLHAHAEQTASLLNGKGWSAAFTAGSLEQSERNESIRKVRKWEVRVFVCTDLISRGVDLEHVDLVINMDLPSNWETYMHRVGRAGRFGSKGASITLYNHQEELDKLLKWQNRCRFQLYPLPNPCPHDMILSDDVPAEPSVPPISEVSQTGQPTSVPSGKTGSDSKQHQSGNPDGESRFVIPDFLVNKLQTVIDIHNAQHAVPVFSRQLDLERFTYQSFKKHYQHFEDTELFLPCANWIKEDSKSPDRLQIKDYTKPPPKIPQCDASFQTSVVDSHAKCTSTENDSADKATDVNFPESTCTNLKPQLNGAQNIYMDTILRVYSQNQKLRLSVEMIQTMSGDVDLKNVRVHINSDDVTRNDAIITKDTLLPNMYNMICSCVNFTTYLTYYPDPPKSSVECSFSLESSTLHGLEVVCENVRLAEIFSSKGYLCTVRCEPIDEASGIGNLFVNLLKFQPVSSLRMNLVRVDPAVSISIFHIHLFLGLTQAPNVTQSLSQQISALQFGAMLGIRPEYMPSSTSPAPPVDFPVFNPVNNTPLALPQTHPPTVQRTTGQAPIPTNQEEAAAAIAQPGREDDVIKAASSLANESSSTSGDLQATRLLSTLEAALSGMQEQIVSAVDKRFNELNIRLDRIERKIDNIEKHNYSELIAVNRKRRSCSF